MNVRRCLPVVKRAEQTIAAVSWTQAEYLGYSTDLAGGR